MDDSRESPDRSVLVALSGGVDSAVAAHLLMQAGWRVETVHLDLLGHGKGDQATERAEALAAFLGLPFRKVSASDLFLNEVITPFVEAYGKGLTPNPCARCNPTVKFRLLIETARSMGISSCATGHYARCKRVGNSWWLCRGVDPKKDQSYFLHRLPTEWLPRLLFPLGEMTKTEVKRIAAQLGIDGMVAQESQEICFLSPPYWRFVEEFGLSLPGPGEIVSRKGEVLGRHRGLHRYTVGQRRGLGIPDATPYYVVALDPEANRVIVGKEEDLYSSICTVKAVNWLAEPQEVIHRPLLVQIRYRHRGAPAEIFSMDDGRISVRFQEPQRAITPGQFAVFYLGDRVVGGGEICG